MGKCKRYKGLKFNYKLKGDDTVFMDKYLSVDEFLNTKFPKNDNELSPTPDTKIFNISLNMKKLCDDKDITVKELKNILKKESLKSNSGLSRKSIHSIEEVRELVKDVMFEKDKRNAKVELDGDLIKGNSHRFQTFFTKGTTCSCCGIKGKYFAKEKHVNDVSYHLNLYAIDSNGNEVLMTKDHILPSSKGGKDNIENYQTMCTYCNMAKGTTVE